MEPATRNYGPYTRLASGSLSHGVPFILTVAIAASALFRVELRDWSSEAWLALSPTVGWGLPMNAIELWPAGLGCNVPVTVAGSSVGQRYDSVGHRKGTYRGRMVVEILN